MPGNDAVEGVEQIHARRIFLGIAEPPRAVILQFDPAFVVGVERKPKSARIGHVNGDRQAKLAAAPPYRIEPRIVDEN